MSLLSTDKIPYEEYRAINELLRTYPEFHPVNLKALIVFGDLVATGQSFDINLLEVLPDWDGPRSISFENTLELPLRGRLNLYFLLPEEFEVPTLDKVPGQQWSSTDLLTQVRRAYAILLEKPNNYAFNAMASLENALLLPSPDLKNQAIDPLSFLKREGRVPT